MLFSERFEHITGTMENTLKLEDSVEKFFESFLEWK